MGQFTTPLDFSFQMPSQRLQPRQSTAQLPLLVFGASKKIFHRFDRIYGNVQGIDQIDCILLTGEIHKHVPLFTLNLASIDVLDHK
jgi:hypothetical protein